MVATSRAWYNGSYTMAAQPIKTLELQYTMIQFLIMAVGSLRAMVYLAFQAFHFLINRRNGDNKRADFIFHNK